MDRRQVLKEVFRDTQKFYRDNEILAAAVARSRVATRLYGEDEYPQLPKLVPGEHAGLGFIANKRTIESACELHKEFPKKKIAVLNFASAMKPGGGVKWGAGAQEESLCRCTTLYPTLDRRWLWKEYYGVNRAAKNVLHTDACIYSPDVVVCKTDEHVPRRLDPKDFFTIDVITCAAPNLSEVPFNYYNPETGQRAKIDPDLLYTIHKRRAEHILHIAAANKVDILILGAFGCGAFENDPNVVAPAWWDASLEYAEFFDVVAFAIYCRGSRKDNYEAFARCMHEAEEETLKEKLAGAPASAFIQ